MARPERTLLGSAYDNARGHSKARRDSAPAYLRVQR